MFFNMCSGGSRQTQYATLFIEADSKQQAVEVFEHHFDRSPYHTTCSCCGMDYSIMDYDTLEEATEYDLKSPPFLEKTEKKYPLTLEEYLDEPFVWIYYKSL